MSLPSLIYVGHIGGATGLGRVADALLSRLAEHWRITVISLSHPPDYHCPYRLIPGVFANDRLGKLAMRKLYADDPPDLILPYFDAAPIIEFMSVIPEHIPIVAYIPVDACNVRDAHLLSRLAHAVFLSPFGLTEARLGGYTGPASVIGHGVDLDVFEPKDKATARHLLNVPQQAFILGAINTNQARKRFDVTLYSFKTFLEQSSATAAYLYCHCAQNGGGWDLPQLAQYLGIADRVLFPPAALLSPGGVSDALMPYVYSALDVQMSTSQGEGFGLTTLEGLACGVPQVIPDFAALADWARDVCTLVPVRTPVVSTMSTNLVNWCVDYREMGEALVKLYHSPARRRIAAEHGLMFVQQPQLRWETLAARFQAVLEGVLRQTPISIGDTVCP